ncbi:hypothetical protein AGMMS50243_27560 [Betaproteobacteria bacterium]|nr:hypothetical protein AGMMS50243_27560 [Betaproteobacteria bacterium]
MKAVYFVLSWGKQESRIRNGGDYIMEMNEKQRHLELDCKPSGLNWMPVAATGLQENGLPTT